MIIQYGGSQLLVPDLAGEVQDSIDKYLEQTFCFQDHFAISESSFSNRDCWDRSLPKFNYPRTPTIRLNEWYRPTGATRWGFGFFLASIDQAATIEVSTEQGRITQTLTIGSITSNEPSQIELRKISCLNHHRFGVGDQALVIIPLVDQRYWWQFKPATDSFSNVATWSDLFDHLASSLGVTLDKEPATIDPDFGFPDHNQFSRYENAARLLDVAAACVGRRVALKPIGTATLTDSAKAYEANQSLFEDETTKKDLIAGAFNNVSNSVPEKIEINWGTSEHLDNAHKTEYAFDDTSDIQSPPGGLAVVGTKFLIHSPWVPADTPEPELQTATDILAGNIYRWWTNGFDLTYRGIFETWKTGLEDYIIYRVGSSVNNFPSVQTRIVALPVGCWINDFYFQPSADVPEAKCKSGGGHIVARIEDSFNTMDFSANGSVLEIFGNVDAEVNDLVSLKNTVQCFTGSVGDFCIAIPRGGDFEIIVKPCSTNNLNDPDITIPPPL